jgi:hypothetical protein
MPVLPQPEVYILRARDKFDAAGNLTDERSASQIKKLLQALVEWTITLKVWGSK